MSTTRTQPRIGYLPKRRKKKQPTAKTMLRIEWLNWLVEEYGASVVADWQQPAVTFQDWKRVRELAAYEAA